LIFDGWDGLGWEERRQRRFARWLDAAAVEFATDDAARLYRERVQMVIDAICLRKPVRVPVVPSVGLYAGRYAGLTVREMMYDARKMATAITRYHEDFRPEYTGGWAENGRVWELLGVKYVEWPGQGIEEDDRPWQYVEREYMLPEEYDELIADPSAYFRRKLLPRHASVFAGLAGLDPFSDFGEAAALEVNILGFADPQVLESVKRLVEAAEASLERMEVVGAAYSDAAARLGIADFGGPGFAKAPYDVLADTLRGTRGIVADLFRRRNKILEAAERLVPLQLDLAKRQTAQDGSPLVSIPLHKGADGFMSDEDFRTLYWPTLKALMKGMIEEGLVPFPFAEGGYNSRLKAIADDELPQGSIVWLFDQTDMKAAKDALGGYACIAGNVPSDLLAVGSGQQVEEYVTRLLGECAGDGGFILSSGAVIDDAKPETLKALIETGRGWCR